MGYATTGQMFQRLTFPIFDEHGQIVGFSGRHIYWTEESSFPKWKHIGRKESWVYPYCTFQNYADVQASFDFAPEIFLVESHGDSMALTENHIYNHLITFGKEVSSTILAFLVKRDPQFVTIVGNRDENNEGQIGAVRALIKLSSDDARLIPLFLYLLMKWEPSFKNHIIWAEGKLENFHRIIATGSDNTSRYFHAYFDKYPNIIRHSRTSVAILDGNESEKELNGLAHDIFDYFGMGCRNVSKVFIPQGYDLNILIKALLPFQEVIKHNKYANNYLFYILRHWL
jgi:hypothetical protein